jgi:hypothetical protein
VVSVFVAQFGGHPRLGQPPLGDRLGDQEPALADLEGGLLRRDRQDAANPPVAPQDSLAEQVGPDATPRPAGELKADVPGHEVQPLGFEVVQLEGSHRGTLPDPDPPGQARSRPESAAPEVRTRPIRSVWIR